MPIVLGSGSPRRRELLTQLGLEFHVVAPDIDESVRAGEAPVTYVHRLAVEKAHAVRSAAAADSLVIAADTTVDLGGEILGKPESLGEAIDMLRRLSARTHRVHTGIALCRGDRTLSEVSTSLVTFAPLSPALIEWYVATGEPFDKAGGYAIQGAGAVLVQRVRGNVSGIIGLPVHAV
ncbi:MAG: nucleoside triphosphate pyrophosphatase, partial [Actinomycetota bacterium]|nr:nucleoside triphosphate pyrophosphatase [Actinomycetota bacterium]